MSLLLSIAHTKGFTLDIHATIAQAIECMLKNATGTVVLVDKKKPKAIVTESLLIEKIAKGIILSSAIINLAQKKLISIHKDAPVESAFDIIVTNNIRRLVMIDNDGDFCGVILQEDLFNFLEEDVYTIDLKVKDLLSNTLPIITISDSSTIQEASLLMHRKHIGSVIIHNSNNQAVGIVTEKDILSVGYKAIDIHQNIQLFMSSPVLSVHEEDAVLDVIDIMKKHNIRRVLVKNQHNETYGLLSNKNIFHHIKGNVARILEIKLRHAKEIMNLLPEAIIEIFDFHSTQQIHWMNNQAKKLFGEQFLNRSPQELMGEASWKKLYHKLHETSSIQKVLIGIQEKSFEFSGSVSKNINNTYIKLIIQDITKHENIKQQLQKEIKEESKLRRENEYLMMQQSRMASMGEMVGHIAHQWRQPLAQLGGIFMNLESAYSFGEFNKTYLEEKVKQGNQMITYMSETIDDFRLFFSHEQKKESFDLVFYLKYAINIVSASLNYHNIEVIVKGEEKIFFALGTPNEFAQAILNLLNNARDALSKQEDSKRRINIIIRQKKKKVNILFCDNGGGIPYDILPNIFEPFVTGNLESGGSGAGLYITRLIIEQKMGGTIKAYNTTHGACFKILV